MHLSIFNTLRLFEVVPPAEDRHADDDNVAEDAERVREFAPGKQAPEGCEEDLGVVEDGDLLGRGVGVGSCYGELAARSAAAREQQEDELLGGHGVVVEDKIRQGQDQRER